MSYSARYRDWQSRYREPSLSLLLVLQALAIFIVGPLMSARLISPLGFDTCLLLMAMVSIVGIAQRGYARVLILLGFGGMVVASAMRALQLDDTWIVSFAASVAYLLFVATITGVVIHTVFYDGAITLHRIRGAVVIYLNVALAFGLIGNMIVMVLPDAYSNIPAGKPSHLGDMIYFSLTTLTTTGYGDIVPVHPIARSLANLEAVIGQLYPATLLATLVGLHVSHRQHNGEGS